VCVLAGPMLRTLDGLALFDHFDFFFEPAPLCRSHWVFRDDDRREFFRQGAEDEGCMVSFTEVCDLNFNTYLNQPNVMRA
jgi:hypothetical protein